MENFKVNLIYKGEELTLDIHPEEAGSYQVIFHGALVGELFMKDAENWEAVPADVPEAGNRPVYEYDETSGHVDMLKDDEVVQNIGKAIQPYL
jgi:hypothetical protein